MSKPTLFGGGKPIPFQDLSADDFQRFVHGALVELGPHVGFRVEGLPGPGGDDGFDAEARTGPGDDVVCIQCKRIPRLTLNIVGLELAKVAMASALNGTEVVAHYFVCAGAVQKDVERAARAKRRQALLDETLAQLGHGDLRVRRERLIALGRDPASIVRDYVTKLRIIVPWSGGAFDAKLGTIMSKLESLIERHFNVSIALREHPRPDFDEEAYLGTVVEPRQITTLQSHPVRPPLGLRFLFETTPQALSRRPVIDVAFGTKHSERLILVGPGGGGKSTSLAVVAALAARAREDDPGSPLPILLPLKDYRGNLDSLIHAELKRNPVESIRKV